MSQTETHYKLRIIGLFALVMAMMLPLPAYASFGVTSSGGFYIVDTGGGLVFRINQSNGDMTSVQLNGIELNDQSKASGIASGLGSATVTATKFGSSYIKITAQTSSSNTVVSNLTHYYMVRNGFNNIYMATYVTSEPAVGELRYIFRGRFDELPNGPPHSNNNGNTGAIESKDVFGHSGGTTSSKYYGNSRALELTNSFQGASGNGVGAWMYYGVNRESSSGGPFFHDIENQGDGAGSDQEIYNYMNSGHNQTEAYRMNVLNGPYALCITSGGPPGSAPDLSFISTLGLTGYVPNSSRGFVSGKASGVLTGIQAVVVFSNSSAQYWTIADSAGNFTSPMMKTGSYTMTLYQGELPVAAKSITVNTGGNSININSTFTQPASIWQIGTWDGKPTEFLNGQNINIMHPSDVRNSNWGPVTFNVGNAVSSFPAVQFRGANTPTTIRFNLTSSQVANHTLRIGITAAYNNGRPIITMNPGTSHAWTSADPGATSQPKSRSITIGTYRGNEHIFTYSIPASAFVAGSNEMQITVASGSGDLSNWLSASWAYDCIELDN